MRALVVSCLVLGGGCLSDLVPDHNVQPVQRGGGGDLAGPADAGTPGVQPDLAGGAAADLAGNNCVPLIVGVGDGHHNPGQACMNCHNAGNPGILQFTVAGTIYDSAAGNNPVAGATITVTDSAGVQQQLVSELNGNFYSTQAVTLPLQPPHASGCPNNAVMGSGPNSGVCNSCHTAGNRIHLP